MLTNDDATDSHRCSTFNIQHSALKLPLWPQCKSIAAATNIDSILDRQRCHPHTLMHSHSAIQVCLFYIIHFINSFFLQVLPCNTTTINIAVMTSTGGRTPAAPSAMTTTTALTMTMML